MTEQTRADLAIEAAADALLAVCALQTGTDPVRAGIRAGHAIQTVMDRARDEAAARGRAMDDALGHYGPL